MIDKYVPRELRKYIYGVAIASIPIAVLLGWVDAEAAVYLIPLIVAILSLTPKDTGVENAVTESESGV